MNPNSYCFHTESRRSPVDGVMVLGKFSVPGRPTSLENSRARDYCACSRCGRGLFEYFFLSPVFSLFFLPRWETA